MSLRTVNHAAGILIQENRPTEVGRFLFQLAAHFQAAAGKNAVAGYPRRIVTCQEGSNRSNLGWLTQTLRRCGIDLLLHNVCGDGLEYIGVNHTGSNAVNCNIFTSIFQC